MSYFASTQGFFIFLTFVAKKRTIALLRGLRNNHHESGQENNDTLDTKLRLSFSLSSAASSEHKTRLRLCIVTQPFSARGEKGSLSSECLIFSTIHC